MNDKASENSIPTSPTSVNLGPERDSSQWEKTKLDLKEALEMWSKAACSQEPSSKLKQENKADSAPRSQTRPSDLDQLLHDLKIKLKELS